MAETSYKKADKNYADILHRQMLINAQQHNKSIASLFRNKILKADIGKVWQWLLTTGKRLLKPELKQLLL